MQYVIYGKNGCPSCLQAKQLLLAKFGEEVVDYKTMGLDYTLAEYVDIAPAGFRTFPMIFKVTEEDGSVFIGGFTDLQASLQ